MIGAFYDAKDDVYQPIFGAQNSIRLPRLLAARLCASTGPSALATALRLLVYVEGLNVTNHANGEEYVYNVDYSRRGPPSPGCPSIAVLGARVEL